MALVLHLQRHLPNVRQAPNDPSDWHTRPGLLLRAVLLFPDQDIGTRHVALSGLPPLTESISFLSLHLRVLSPQYSIHFMTLSTTDICFFWLFLSP